MLNIKPQVLQMRLQQRKDHFMPASMLKSQLDTLQFPDVHSETDVWVIHDNGDKTIDDTVTHILSLLRAARTVMNNDHSKLWYVIRPSLHNLIFNEHNR